MTVSLHIGGRSHQGWKTAQISRGVRSVAGSFELTVTDRWPGQSAQVSIRPGDSCQVMVNGETVITGYVDEVRPSYSAGDHAITFKGRSKTADLVDCSVVHDGGQFKGRTLLQIAKDMANPFGITVRSETDVGAALNEDINQGETVADVLEELALMRGVLVCDDANGNLVLTRAGAVRARGSILHTKDRGNVLSSSGSFSMDGRFSLYVVKGQSAGDDEVFGAAASEPSAQEKDQNVLRYRPLVVVAEKQATIGLCRERAAWERSVRAGQSVDLTYTVQGWTQAGGALWQPNTLVSVRDDFLKVNGQFLISEVTWQISSSGQTTRLQVAPPEAFAPQPSMPETSEAVAFWNKPAGAQ